MVEVIGYARTSTNEQYIQNQIDKLKEAGAEVIFADEGVSGKKLARERPEFKELLNYLDQHPEVKKIIVFELSRIGRNMQDTFNTVLNIEKRGVMIWSLKEVWTQRDDPEFRPLLISIFSWVNQQELKRLSDRTKAGLDRARKEGKQIGGQWKKIDKKVYEDLVAKGYSFTKIASIMNVDVSTLYRRRRQWKREELGRGSTEQNS